MDYDALAGALAELDRQGLTHLSYREQAAFLVGHIESAPVEPRKLAHAMDVDPFSPWDD